MKRVPLLMVVFAMCLALGPPASATEYTLTDKNSTVYISPDTDSGVYGWVVDGSNILATQWFWVGLGDAAEKPINQIGTTTVRTQTSPDVLTVDYASADLTITVKYTLLGGVLGSFWSDVGEQIQIINNATSALNVHFFQYSDFDLGNIGNDSVEIDPSKRSVRQTPGSGGPVLTETVITPAASRAEAGIFAATLGKLNDADRDNLNNVLTAGPADVTWAFQWDFTIGAGGNVLISKDKRVEHVPEPAAIGLLGGVLLVVASKLRKRLA